MKILVSYEFNTLEEAVAFLDQKPAEPPVEPPPPEPPPVEPPSNDVWQTTDPKALNYWPPIFGPPPEGWTPSQYRAAGYQIPYRPSGPPTQPPVPPPQPPPIVPPPPTPSLLPVDFILGWKYRTIRWCEGSSYAGFYRWEEPMCMLQQFMYDIKSSGFPFTRVLDEFSIEDKPLRSFLGSRDETFEAFLCRAWDETYHGDLSGLYKRIYGETAMMGDVPLWKWMMDGKEHGFSAAVWDDLGRGSKRAYSNYWNGFIYIGPFDTNYGKIDAINPWHAEIKRVYGIA